MNSIVQVKTLIFDKSWKWEIGLTLLVEEEDEGSEL